MMNAAHISTNKGSGGAHPHKGRVIDTTLREGEQAYGVYFSSQMKRLVVAGLVQAGADEIELGNAGQEDLPELYGWARERCGDSVLSAWCPCREQDVVRAAGLGFARINVGVPSSDKHMAVRLGMGRTGLLDKMESVVRAARGAGVEYVSVGLEDCSRADEKFLVRAAQRAQSAGASRVRLSDTVGLMTPLRMARLVRLVCERVGLDVAVHCHNDLGMATANAATALEAGATYADVSVLGLGERAGIAPLEEVLAHLALSGEEGGYDVSAAVGLCRRVAASLDRVIPVDKAVAGKKIFACETGLHVHGILRDPALFEPFAPELAGASRVIGLGKKSGRAAVAEAVARHGANVPDTALCGLTQAVRTRAATLGRPLTDEEFIATCASFKEKNTCATT